jgi:hypothetical protein
VEISKNKDDMRESTIEAYLIYTVAKLNGKTYKFQSPSHRGVSDRIVCLPNGETWFVELKTEKGRLSSLQEVFARDMKNLNQKYACLWSIEEVDKWKSKREI